MSFRIAAVAFACLTEISSAYAQSEPLADGGFAASALSACKTDLRYLNHVSGWQGVWPREWQAVAASAASSAEAIARWQAAPAAVNDAIDALRTGIVSKETAPRPVVLRVLQQVRDLIGALDARDSRYFAESAAGGAWNALIKDEILPALIEYERFLDVEYLPKARRRPGLSDIENGEDCFRHAVAFWTTLDLSRDEIEAVGRRLLEATRADLAATGEDGADVEKIMERLREWQTTDMTTAAELIAISEKVLTRAQDATLLAFEKTARRPIDVVEMPAHVQASFPAGYYVGPNDDPASAGQYVINPSRPCERRLMAEAIAFHEGVPGHHLFFDYPRETPSQGFNAGLLEGWGLYSEYVADEMGLYSTTFDRQGMMAKHLWAASRLIVEPGLHLRGWSREKAIDFMLESTLLPRAEIEIEIDRYIAMPGHSLSYMLGADLILSERERARAELGPAFDIRAFHELVVGPGVRPLPQLRDEIRAWAALSEP
jgi:uncharacterized protein (DUF885 family)